LAFGSLYAIRTGNDAMTLVQRLMDIGSPRSATVDHVDVVLGSHVPAKIESGSDCGMLFEGLQFGLQLAHVRRGTLTYVSAGQ
jgi:hypothetical protein